MSEQARAPEWIEALFSRLMVSYGQEWRTMWSGIEPIAVQRDWYAKLRLVHERNPAAIRYALDHLPDRVPNAEKFRALCLQAPSPHIALPAPVSKPDPQFAAQVMQRIDAAKHANPEHGLSPGEICARRLEAILARGGQLSFPQRAQLDAIRGMKGPAPAPMAAAASDADIAERKDAIARQVAEYQQLHAEAVPA